MKSYSFPHSHKNFTVKGCFFVFLGIVILSLAGTAIYQRNRSNISSVAYAGTYAQTTSSSTSAPNQAANPPSQSNSLQLGLEIQSTENGKIKGTLSVVDNASLDFGEVYYDLHIDTPQVEQTIDALKAGIPLPLPPPGASASPNAKVTIVLPRYTVSYTDALGPFGIRSGEKKSFPFEIAYSPHLEPGTYTMYAAAFSNLENFYGTAVKNVDLSGRNDSLVLNNDCIVTTNSKQYNTIEAPLVQKHGSVEGKCSFTNSTDRPLTLNYVMNYAFLHVFHYPHSEKLTWRSNQPTIFNAHETKSIIFLLPTNLPPQVYEAYMQFIDTQGNAQSPMASFRWSIAGESGRIESVIADKDYYTKGDTANITTVADPSMDLYWKGIVPSAGTELPNATLQLSIYDSNNQPCGSKQIPVSSPFTGPKTLTLEIPIQKDCLNPSVQARLMNNGQELANGTTKLLTSQTTLASVKTHLPPNLLLLLAFIILTITFIAAAAIIIVKRRSGTNPWGTKFLCIILGIFILIMGLAGVSYHLVLATTVISAPGTIYHQLSKDNNVDGNANMNTYFSGTTVNSSGNAITTLSGTVHGSFCGNSGALIYIWDSSTVTWTILGYNSQPVYPTSNTSLSASQYLRDGDTWSATLTRPSNSNSYVSDFIYTYIGHWSIGWYGFSNNASYNNIYVNAVNAYGPQYGQYSSFLCNDNIYRDSCSCTESNSCTGTYDSTGACTGTQLCADNVCRQSCSCTASNGCTGAYSNTGACTTSYLMCSDGYCRLSCTPLSMYQTAEACGDNHVHLALGWTFLGIPSSPYTTSETPSEFFQRTGSACDAIYGYDPSQGGTTVYFTDPMKAPLNDIVKLTPGYGYSVHCTSPVQVDLDPSPNTNFVNTTISWVPVSNAAYYQIVGDPFDTNGNWFVTQTTAASNTLLNVPSAYSHNFFVKAYDSNNNLLTKSTSTALNAISCPICASGTQNCNGTCSTTPSCSGGSVSCNNTTAICICASGTQNCNGTCSTTPSCSGGSVSCNNTTAVCNCAGGQTIINGSCVDTTSGLPTVTTSSACISSGDNGSDITISWPNGSTPVTYVDVSTDPNFVSFSNKAVSGSANQTASTTGAGFSNGFLWQPTMTYYIRTWNGYSHSSTITFNTYCALSAPSGVSSSNLACTQANKSNVQIAWNGVSNATSYDVYRSNASSSGIFNGLVSYWNMREASGSTVADIGSNTGTAQETTIVQGKIGNARSFNGNSNFIQIPTPSSLNNLTVVSVSAWVKSTDAHGTAIITIGDGGSYGYQLWWGSGHLDLWSNGVGLNSPATYNDGNWHQVVGVWDGSTGLLYVDGSKVASTTMTIQATTLDAQIGTQCSSAGSTGCNSFFNGTIDEVGVWNRILSGSEISTLYTNNLGTKMGSVTSPVTSFTDSTAASATSYYYAVDECSSTSCSDQAGGSPLTILTLNCTPPTVSNLVADSPNATQYCGNANQHLSWTFSDAQDGSGETAYEVQISTNNSFSSFVYDSAPGTTCTLDSQCNADHICMIQSGNTSGSCQVGNRQKSAPQQTYMPVSTSPSTNQLAFNTTYYWRVQVFNSGGLSSGWITGLPFTTPIHAWPSSAFTYTPSSPSINETVTFNATYPNGYGTTAPTFTWSFTHATPSTGTGSTAQTKFTQSGPSNSATLTATDDAGTCTTQQSFNIKPPLPQFKEIQPASIIPPILRMANAARIMLKGMLRF